MGFCSQRPEEYLFQKITPRPSPEYMSSTDLKPCGQKAPLTLLPAAPLRAVAAVFEHGGVKYAPWNFQDTSQPQARLAELYSAILRHTLAAGDPSQPDFDPESGLHHILHAAASCLIAAHKLGLDYVPSKLLLPVPEGTRDRAETTPKSVPEEMGGEAAGEGTV